MVRRLAPVLLLLLLGACSTDPPARLPPSPTPAGAGTAGAATPDAGTGSAENPFQARCTSGGQGQVETTPEPADFTIGPRLRYASARSWATTAPPAGTRLSNGRYFYKTGALVRAGTVVTVTVAHEARAYAAIDVQYGPEAGVTAVTYNACPRPPDTMWPGGFLLRRRTACVPLDVKATAEPHTRHVVLSVYGGTCPPRG